MSYCCDRGRSVTWGLYGGLPSIPHGAWINQGTSDQKYMGTVFSGHSVEPSTQFSRPSAGGGGLGDPLNRKPELVLEDVIDGYVSIERAAKDYGVMVRVIDMEICSYEVDFDATARLREEIRQERIGWLDEDPLTVQRKYTAGEIDALDVIRRFGVILDWGTGKLLAESTKQFREMMKRRSSAFWH